MGLRESGRYALSWFTGLAVPPHYLLPTGAITQGELLPSITKEPAGVETRAGQEKRKRRMQMRQICTDGCGSGMGQNIFAFLNETPLVWPI